MIQRSELRRIARERLKDAEALLLTSRYDGAIYLGGYVVELALKSRICRTLKWQGFPESRGEFQNYQSFKTHDLEILLSLSGMEPIIKAKYLAEWSSVARWNPELRYKATSDTTMAVTQAKHILARLLVDAARKLLGVL